MQMDFCIPNPIITFPESNWDVCLREERRDEAICSYISELRDCLTSFAKTILSRNVIIPA